MRQVYSDEVYRIAFTSYRGINRDTAERFRQLGIDEADFFNKDAATLAAVTGLKPGYFDDSRRAEALAMAQNEELFLRQNKVQYVHCLSPEYPARLAECNDAPAALFCSGDMAPTANKCMLSIVGTRHSTPYGMDFCRRLVQDLAVAVDGLTVVSGLAYGVDICAHRAAMDADVPTVAVVAHGLKTIYPADHRSDAVRIVRSGGAILTEYHSGAAVHRGNFLERNRIVAGLSDVTVVIESDLKGGAMATARLAYDYHREVMALPGRINDQYSRGCNELIRRQRASLISSAEDLIAAAGWTPRQSAGQQRELVLEVPQEYTPVLDAMAKYPTATLNELCAVLGMPYARLSALVFRMEMDDFIISLPGGRFGLPARK